jgi:hypothetical protein
MHVGGRGGIRTHGTFAGTPVFKTGALNHSATLPMLRHQSLSAPKIKNSLGLTCSQNRRPGFGTCLRPRKYAPRRSDGRSPRRGAARRRRKNTSGHR